MSNETLTMNYILQVFFGMVFLGVCLVGIIAFANSQGAFEPEQKDKYGCYEWQEKCREKGKCLEAGGYPVLVKVRGIYFFHDYYHCEF